MTSPFLIVRALVIVNQHILLLRPTNKNSEFSKTMAFLPGGHVNYGEGGKMALKRELLEELGKEFEIGRFLATLECSWNRKCEIYHEINLLFQASHPSLSEKKEPLSKEGHIQFFWHPLKELDSLDLLPKTLKSAIPKIFESSSCHDTWFSELINNSSISQK